MLPTQIRRLILLISGRLAERYRVEPKQAAPLSSSFSRGAPAANIRLVLPYDAARLSS